MRADLAKRSPSTSRRTGGILKGLVNIVDLLTWVTQMTWPCEAYVRVRTLTVLRMKSARTFADALAALQVLQDRLRVRQETFHASPEVYRAWGRALVGEPACARVRVGVERDGHERGRAAREDSMVAGSRACAKNIGRVHEKESPEESATGPPALRVGALRFAVASDSGAGDAFEVAILRKRRRVWRPARRGQGGCPCWAPTPMWAPRRRTGGVAAAAASCRLPRPLFPRRVGSDVERTGERGR